MLAIAFGAYPAMGATNTTITASVTRSTPFLP